MMGGTVICACDTAGTISLYNSNPDIIFPFVILKWGTLASLNDVFGSAGLDG